MEADVMTIMVLQNAVLVMEAVKNGTNQKLTNKNKNGARN
jgi:hypothetical protein